MEKENRIIFLRVLEFLTVILLLFLFSFLFFRYDTNSSINDTEIFLNDFRYKETGELFKNFNKKLKDNEVTLETTFYKTGDDVVSIGISNYYAAVEVKVNGATIYNYGNQNDLDNNVRLGNLYEIVNLDVLEDTVNDLEITYRSNSPLTIYSIDSGTNTALNLSQFKEYSSVIGLTIAAVMFFFFVLLNYLKKENRVFFHISDFWLMEFFITSSLWTLFDSQILQYLGVPAGLVCQLSVLVYGVFPVILLTYISSATDEIIPLARTVFVLCFINILIVMFMDALNIRYLIDNLIFLHVNVVVILLTCFAQLILHFKKKHTLSSLYILSGFILFIIIVIIQYIFFFINPTKSNSNAFIVGLLAFYIMLIIRFYHMIGLERKRHDDSYVSIIEAKNKELEEKNLALYKTFGRFVPNENINELLISKTDNAIKGSKMNVTILQCDIRGFSDLIVPMSASDLVIMLNNFFDTIAGIIQKYDGTVISFVGDAVLAAFGMDGADNGHASAAIAAALDMQRDMSKINHFNKLHDLPNFEIGIGVNTGEVSVGYLGSEKHMKFDIIGSPVNVCSRIESYTTGGQIMIAESTLNAARNVDIFENYIVFPKGSKEPVMVYSVCGIGAPYNVAYDVKYVNPIQLDNPIKIDFSLIYSKHVQPENYEAVILKASENSMLLKTDVKLSLFDNIQINSYVNIYGKVIAKELTGYLIRTSINYDIKKVEANSK